MASEDNLGSSGIRDGNYVEASFEVFKDSTYYAEFNEVARGNFGLGNNVRREFRSAKQGTWTESENAITLSGFATFKAGWTKSSLSGGSDFSATVDGLGKGPPELISVGSSSHGPLGRTSVDYCRNVSSFRTKVTLD